MLNCSTSAVWICCAISVIHECDMNVVTQLLKVKDLRIKELEEETKILSYKCEDQADLLSKVKGDLQIMLAQKNNEIQ